MDDIDMIGQHSLIQWTYAVYLHWAIADFIDIRMENHQQQQNVPPVVFGGLSGHGHCFLHSIDMSGDNDRYTMCVHYTYLMSGEVQVVSMAE